MASLNEEPSRRNGAGNGHAWGPNGHDRPEPAAPPRWDRGPDQGLAKKVAGAKRRRVRALVKARQVLTRKTLGSDAIVAERLRLLAEIYGTYHAAGALIVELELL